jgi:hypothetical protein
MSIIGGNYKIVNVRFLVPVAPSDKSDGAAVESTFDEALDGQIGLDDGTPVRLPLVKTS